ncbi:MAG: riboflavin synthase [Planctomycetes bacterium]|nr:riboflavin synthase [Planctomycetota bacterium]
MHELRPTPAGVRLVVQCREWDHRAGRGDSIAVNGCCLTAVADVGKLGRMAFDAVPETLSKTTLGSLRVGDRVNLEHAATASTLLGGHIVQGHVDGVGSVAAIKADGQWRVRVKPPRELLRYMTPKGSVSLDGVSLTLAAVGSSWIEVALIPTTLEKTTLASWRVGTRINIEADVMAKTIVTHLERMGEGRRR